MWGNVCLTWRYRWLLMRTRNYSPPVPACETCRERKLFTQGTDKLVSLLMNFISFCLPAFCYGGRIVRNKEWWSAALSIGSSTTSQICEYLCVLPLVQELRSRDGISSKWNIHLPGSGFSIIKRILQHPTAGSAASTERGWYTSLTARSMQL